MSNFSIKKSEPPETKEILAEAIVKVSAGLAALEQSGLNRDAIVTLLRDKTKVGKRDIEAVLDGLKHLRGWYCR